MTMNDAPMAILSVLAGTGAGIFFFGGLWWTVRRVAASPRPAVLVMASMMGRTFLTIAVFYFASGGQWQRLLFCLAGFIAARVFITRLLPKAQTPDSAILAKASHHAP
jgi:F1F0 ATPase subunit 2